MKEPELRLREIWFDGESYVPELDRARLKTQLERVFAVMKDGRWHYLGELAKATGGSEAGVSARLRDLRKPRFGGHTVEHEREEGGLWRYRLIVSWAEPQERLFP